MSKKYSNLISTEGGYLKGLCKDKYFNLRELNDEDLFFHKSISEDDFKKLVKKI